MIYVYSDNKFLKKCGTDESRWKYVGIVQMILTRSKLYKNKLSEMRTNSFFNRIRSMDIFRWWSDICNDISFNQDTERFLSERNMRPTTNVYNNEWYRGENVSTDGINMKRSFQLSWYKRRVKSEHELMDSLRDDSLIEYECKSSWHHQ